jgi:carbamoyltransferase
MITWGITAMNHDASLAVVQDNKLVYASSSERYTKIKQDKHLCQELVDDARAFGKPDRVVFYENPWKKKGRQLRLGQWKALMKELPSTYLKRFGIRGVEYGDHHDSHAKTGYYTSPFQHAVVVTIDAIGEWATFGIHCGYLERLDRVQQINYPSSIGLFYSAFTKRCGLKPNEEEYIMMGMAAFGKPIYAEQIYDDFFVDSAPLFELKRDVWRGVGDYLPEADPVDIAASVQAVTERVVLKVMRQASRYSSNLVYVGGVALNCVLNAKIAPLFENMWIFPNPGDAGSAVGCALDRHVQWDGPYLGKSIDRELDVEAVARTLAQGKAVGIANGPAEFGPRALGNRSLLADPRKIENKVMVNQVKRRHQFRPFAPAVLERFVHDYFEMPVPVSPYMQYVGKCRYPAEFPAICHYDNTSRVQTVNEKNNPRFNAVLEEFYRLTGCPMVLNTSLNIRGQPILNDLDDARKFTELYDVEIY